MSKIDDVARGLLVDAFITYAAICQEKGYGVLAHVVWRQALDEMSLNLGRMGTRESEISSAILAPVVRGVVDLDVNEHVEMLIAERRGLIRDTMREEMADLEAASPSSEDAEGIRDGESG